jgi:hypothetical protein
MNEAKAYNADYIYYKSKPEHGGWLLVRDGVVVGLTPEKPPTDYEQIVFSNSAIFPAFINTYPTPDSAFTPEDCIYNGIGTVNYIGTDYDGFAKYPFRTILTMDATSCGNRRCLDYASKLSKSLINDPLRKVAIKLGINTADMAQEATNLGIMPILPLESSLIKRNFLELIPLYYAANLLDELSENEIKILSEFKANIIFCFTENMQKIPPVPRLIKDGANMALGGSCNIIKEILTAALLFKGLNYNSATMDAKTVFSMASKNAGTALNLKSGILSERRPADFIVVSFNSAHMSPVYDHLSHLIYVAEPTDISHLFVNGRELMGERRIL